MQTKRTIVSVNWWVVLLAVAGIVGILNGAFGCQKEQAAVPTVTAPTANWEYKTTYVSAPNHEATGPNALAVNDIPLDEAALNDLGKVGWELSAAYVETETAYPNLGDPKYITGLKSNVRPKRIVLVFKRQVH